MAFWKREQYGDQKRSVVTGVRGGGEINTQSAEDFQAVKIACGCHNCGYTSPYVCPNPRMCNTKSRA